MKTTSARATAQVRPAITNQNQSASLDKKERANQIAFFFFMGALLIGFATVAVAALFLW